MKLLETNNTIEQIGNITGESQFKMKTSRKAFQILSDLYSDKPLAIVRELGCNAADSMTAAGKGDQPFHIHIPNTLEPWITIQDFGTGISHDDIYSIYSVYFESTKTNTNSQIGCLGLGSKSPFCYTDNFIITSIHDGTKRIYNAFFNESNTPAIALMSTEKTTDSNGVAIQIPVKASDFVEFVRAVKQAFRFFDVKPTISGGKIDWLDETPIFEGEGWSSYGRFGYNEAYAIMGGVTYPIDIYLMGRHTKHNQFLGRGGLVLKFDIGELDFTPSRESLSYCPQTIEAIKNKLDFVVEDFKGKLESTIQNKTKLIDAIRTLSSLSEKFYHLGIDFSKITWKGISIYNPMLLINNLCKVSASSKIITYSYAKHSRKKFRESNQVNFADKTKWYYDDLAKGTAARVKSHLRNNPDDCMCIFSMDAYNAVTNNSNPDMTFDKDMFLPTSSLPKAFRAPIVRSNGNVVTSTGMRIYRHGNSYQTIWDSEEFDASKPPKYYIVKNTSDWNFNLKIHKDIYPFNCKTDLYNLAEFLGISTDDIVMVSARHEKALANVSIKLEDYIKTIKLDFDIRDIATYQKYGNYMKDFSKIKKYKEFASNNADHPVVKFVDMVCSLGKKVEKYKSINNKFMKEGKCHQVESDNPAIKLLVSKITDFSWNNDDIVTILENLKK